MAEPELERIEVSSALDLAYRSIRRAILGGRFEMGRRLIDARLAENLGVSRPTARAALARLADEGLVVERPRQGVFVRDFGPQEIVDLFNIRVALEPLAARLIVRRRAALGLLREINDRIGQAAAIGDRVATVAAVGEFHQALVALSGNQPLAELFRSVYSQLQMALAVEFAQRVAGSDGPHHIDVIEALEKGDEDEAVSTVRSHILANIEDVIRQLGADPTTLVREP
jgi:DNA-binding GntR family transcriptional regulator